MLYKIKKLKIFDYLRPVYHYVLAFLGAVFYFFPSRKIKVIAVTGTKGKTSTVEILSAIFEEAGKKTSLASTLRFKVGERSENNLFKMTMPGRFFLQRFLRQAVSAGSEYAIVEMTSEGAKQYRHKFIALDVLIFTNIAPEHIESHGSFEKYLAAKTGLARALERSPKKGKVIVANVDDEHGPKFLTADVEIKKPYRISDAEPYQVLDKGLEFVFRGQNMRSHLSGKFNLYNILAAAVCAESQGIDIGTIKRAVEKFQGIRGRVESVIAGQDFSVIVDYAHTPDSLEKFYEVFQNSKKICVLGNTGGGRDKWKRPAMGRIADRHCDEIILTDEDSYDEDPSRILAEMAEAIINTPYEIILDRREAIARAIARAESGDAVLITGKGTDPYIMGPGGQKMPWNDAAVAKEEIDKLIKK